MLAGLALFVIYVVQAFTSGYSYDEAYNLQIPHNLLQGNGYSTDGSLYDGDLREFDALITTGPAMLLPVTAVAAILGEHPFAFRVVPLLAFVALLCLWARMAMTACAGVGRFGPYSSWAMSAAAAGSVMAINVTAATASDSPLRGPVDVLGEFMAAALVTGALVASRRPAVSGLLFGLAILTKFLALIALPGLLLAVAMSQPARRRLITIMQLCLASSILPALWQVVKLASVGVNMTRERNTEFWSWFFVAGSGARDTGPDVVEVAARLLKLTVLCPTLVLLLAMTAIVLVVKTRRARALNLLRTQPAVAGALFSGATLTAWWLVAADNPWPRHAVIGVALLLPSLTITILASHARGDAQVEGLARDRTGLLHLVTAAAVGLSAWGALSTWSLSVTDQRRMAEDVAKLAEPIYVPGWNQIPELALLGDTRVQQQGDNEGSLLLIGLSPVLGMETPDACGRVVRKWPGYLLCESQLP